jgi:hypothetical protein
VAGCRRSRQSPAEQGLGSWRSQRPRSGKRTDTRAGLGRANISEFCLGKLCNGDNRKFKFHLTCSNLNSSLSRGRHGYVCPDNQVSIAHFITAIHPSPAGKYFCLPRKRDRCKKESHQALENLRRFAVMLPRRSHDQELGNTKAPAPASEQVGILSEQAHESGRKDSARTAEAPFGAVEGKRALSVECVNNEPESMVSNTNINSKPHLTAEELKKVDDENKAEEDNGPMSPFFM